MVRRTNCPRRPHHHRSGTEVRHGRHRARRGGPPRPQRRGARLTRLSKRGRRDDLTLNAFEPPVVAPQLAADLIGGAVIAAHVGREGGAQIVVERDGRAAVLAVYKDELYQLVMVPVRAPEPIAWAMFGFLLRGRLDQELQSLTGLRRTAGTVRQGASHFSRVLGEIREVVVAAVVDGTT